jgi:hypothetical protein
MNSQYIIKKNDRIFLVLPTNRNEETIFNLDHIVSMRPDREDPSE